MQRLTYPIAPLLALILSVAVPAATILHYDFEDGTPETPMNNFPVTQQNGTVGTVDLSGNGYHMHAWDDYWGPWFSAAGDTPTGTGLSSVHEGHNDGYTLADGIRAWSPSTWTIEVSFKLNDPDGWRTLIGRDDWTGIAGDVAAAFYLQSNGENNAMRVTFATVSGERYFLDSSLIPAAGQWYHLAAVGEGDLIEMYADSFDGYGFQKIGSLTMTPGVNHALRPTGNWTFGRGWHNGNFVDHIDGNLDNIRFSDVALTTDEFIPSTFLSARMRAHTPQPRNGAKNVPVNQVLSWQTGVDPANPDRPNPAITGHNLWLSAAYDAANPPLTPDWQDPAIQIFQIPSDTNPADGNVDPAASYSPPLLMDKVYFWIVDESLGAAHPRDWPNIIAGVQWSFSTVTSAPVVDAGPSIVTWLKGGTTTVNLNGTVTDETGDVTGILWSVVSSPAGSTVQIAGPSSPATTATLNMTGRYVLRLWAVDAAQHEQSDEMAIDVYNDSCQAAQNNPNGYSAPAFDANGDCRVDFRDFAMFADTWLEDQSLTQDALY